MTAITISSDSTSAFGAAIGQLSSTSAQDTSTARFNLRAAQVSLDAATAFSVVQTISAAQLLAAAKISKSAYDAANSDNKLVSDPYLAGSSFEKMI